MEREYLLNYLEEIKKIATQKYDELTEENRQTRNYYLGVKLQTKYILLEEQKYSDKDLLERAIQYKNIKPLFN